MIHPHNHMHIFQSTLISQYMCMCHICDNFIVDSFVYFLVFQLVSKDVSGKIKDTKFNSSAVIIIVIMMGFSYFHAF